MRVPSALRLLHYYYCLRRRLRWLTLLVCEACEASRLLPRLTLNRGRSGRVFLCVCSRTYVLYG